MQKELCGSLLMLITICFSTGIFAETITLKSGKTVEGNITQKTDKYIKVGSEGVTLTYYSDEIDSIDGKKFDQFSIQGTEVTGPLPAQEIIQKVIKSYLDMSSYASNGTIEDNFNISGAAQKQIKTVTIKLKKPDLYKIVWQGQGPVGFDAKGIVWNAGQGAYVEQSGQYQQYTSDKMALGAATGVSGGAAFVIPSLFLNIGIDPFKKFENLKLVGSDTVEGKECYVISGETPISTEDKFWITKDKYLIVQRSYKLDKKPVMPAFTDAQIDESIKATGMEVNDENRQKMKQMMEMSKAAMSSIKLNGDTHLEQYTGIVIDQDIASGEFANEVPPGAQQNAMGMMFDHLDGVKYSMISAQGIGLSAEEVGSLESGLINKPDDFEARLKLLGYYFSKQTPEAVAKKQEHIIWIVENKPDFPGGEFIWPEMMLTPQIDGNVYEQVKQLWLGEVQKYPTNATVLRNAARYFKFSDASLSKELFEKAKAIDPKTLPDEK